MIAVTSLIEEKAQLHDQKQDLKRNCREEKYRLDAELERIRERNDDLQKAEHAEYLQEIDDNYEAEY